MLAFDGTPSSASAVVWHRDLLPLVLETMRACIHVIRTKLHEVPGCALAAFRRAPDRNPDSPHRGDARHQTGDARRRGELAQLAERVLCIFFDPLDTAPAPNAQRLADLRGPSRVGTTLRGRVRPANGRPAAARARHAGHDAPLQAYRPSPTSTTITGQHAPTSSAPSSASSLHPKDLTSPPRPARTCVWPR